MIGIEDIGVYIPSNRVSNYERRDDYGIDNQFITSKLGIERVAIKEVQEQTSDLAVKALDALFARNDISKDDIECLVVVTQNPDYNLPHVSAVVHDKAALPTGCAAFDLSLGCSGFVYGLSIIESFMERNELGIGILVTADPYSGIIDSQDRNTAMLFGDAATATLITQHPRFVAGKFSFGTLGEQHRDLICENGRLSMNGRGVFNFAARYVPKDIKTLVKRNNLSMDQIDLFLFHQASRYIVDTVASRLRIPPEKVVFRAQDYGNTVSSSIPILLSTEAENSATNTLVMSGFGVGLSWASGVLFRNTAW